MALFSRSKSKAKKAEKEEAQKAEDEAKTTMPNKAPERGRKGKEAMRPSQHDYANALPPIPGSSSQPSPHLNRPSNRSKSSAHDHSDSFEESDDLFTLKGKQDHFYRHSTSDSGYSSAGPRSGSISRTSIAQREMGCFQISNKSMPQLTLGEEIAREPSFSTRPSLQDDTTDRSTIGLPNAVGSRFLMPSRSLQGMRAYFRPTHGDESPPALPNQTRYQDARYQRQIQQSMPMRPASVPPQASRSKSERVSRPPIQRSASPGPVSQSARTAYALRSLATVPSSSRLPNDWSGQIPSNLDQQLQAMLSQSRTSTPPIPHETLAPTNLPQNESSPSLSILQGFKVNRRGLILDEEGDPIGELCEGEIIDCVRQKVDAYGDVLDEYGRVVGRVRTLLREETEPMLRSKSSNLEQLHGFPLPPDSAKILLAKSGSSSSTKTKSSLRRRKAAKQDDEPSTPPRSPSHGSNILSQGQDHGQVSDQQEAATPRLHSRSESLPSVPESHSTAEIELSDDGSYTSEESQQANNEEERQHSDDGKSSQAQVGASSNATTEHSRRNPMSSHGRSVSEPMYLKTAFPPIPASSRNTLEPKKAMVSPADSTTIPVQLQRPGLTTTPSRVKSFPRELTGGLPGNSPFAGAPIPGQPARRLTTPAFPMSSPLGMASLNKQPPMLRPRISGTIPLVRSPLSTQENSPPDSDDISATNDSKPTFAQVQAYSSSQSMKCLSNNASAIGVGKPRKSFGHTDLAAANKEVDVVVQEIGIGKKTEKEKRKGIKGLFGRKN